jgi:hypothetical protein
MDTNGGKRRKNGEIFIAEEKLLRGNQEKPQKRKSNPAKGKARATGRSGTGGDFNIGFKQCFQK